MDDYVFKFHQDLYNPIISGVKHSIMRLDLKPVECGEWYDVEFVGTNLTTRIKIIDIYTVKFRRLRNVQAMYEGYHHVDLLKHELKNIYPDITGDTTLYVYMFRGEGWEV